MSMKVDKRPEPVIVAMIWEDLWLVAIYLTNLEIAGSPRKVYRDRGMSRSADCRALAGLESVSNSTQLNSEY